MDGIEPEVADERFGCDAHACVCVYVRKRVHQRENLRLCARARACVCMCAPVCIRACDLAFMRVCLRPHALATVRRTHTRRSAGRAGEARDDIHQAFVRALHLAPIQLERDQLACMHARVRACVRAHVHEHSSSPAVRLCAPSPSITSNPPYLQSTPCRALVQHSILLLSCIAVELA
jgi:hypothetical protein